MSNTFEAVFSNFIHCQNKEIDESSFKATAKWIWNFWTLLLTRGRIKKDTLKNWKIRSYVKSSTVRSGSLSYLMNREQINSHHGQTIKGFYLWFHANIFKWLGSILHHNKCLSLPIVFFCPVRALHRDVLCVFSPPWGKRTSDQSWLSVYRAKLSCTCF